MADEYSLSRLRQRAVALATSIGAPVDPVDDVDDLRAIGLALDAFDGALRRTEHVLDALHSIAALEFSTRVELSGDGTVVDAVAASVNMLAEEMAASHTALEERTREVYAQKTVLEAVLDSMAEGVIVANERGDYVVVNPAARRLVGDDWSTSARRKGIHRIDRRTPIPDEELPLYRAIHGESVDELELFVWNERVPEGIEISVTGRPVVDATGGRHGGLIVFRDVTDRNRTDATVRRLAAIVDASTDAIISYKLDGTITTWNRGAEQLYGCPADDAVGSSFERFIPPDGVSEWRDRVIGRVLRGHRVANHEAWRIRSDGSRVLVSMSASAIADASGAVVGLSAIARDITTQKAMEHQLQEALERAEAAARAKSQFLANMSHEIRTPLTAILGFTDLLLAPNVGESERLNYLMTIRRNGEHLLAVINDVLDLSKIEAGAMRVENIECSPSEILNDVASSMRVRATDKGIGFDVRFASAVPARIRSDPTRLRQILMNLVGNAVKFTERGHVDVVARLEGSALVVEVHDTGIGIKPEEVREMFRPFHQGDASLTRRFGGTGLGLAISVPLAAALGGTIAADSRPGGGSTFTLRLPVEISAGTPMVSSLTDGRASMDPRAPTAVSSAPIRARVLLAEDGIDNQVLISTMLVQRGADVSVAENGRVAVELVQAALEMGQPFDLVLMDMQMPELDGYGATARLRAMGYKRPIVALTAHALTGERERCLAAGCDDYLAKPVDRGLLIDTVRRYVAGSTREIFSALADDPEMEPLVAGFVARTRDAAMALRRAEIEGDIDALKRLVHQIKGAGGGYGFTQLSEAARAAEAALAAGLPAARDSVQRLIDVCERLRAGREGQP